jgi:hypothetical protein
MGWPKGKKRSAETRAKISAASKAQWADPAVRAKISAASKAAMADPAVRAKISAARKARRSRACFHCGHRGYGLIPLDGIAGEFECRDDDKCEDRILKRDCEIAKGRKIA